MKWFAGLVIGFILSTIVYMGWSTSFHFDMELERLPKPFYDAVQSNQASELVDELRHLGSQAPKLFFSDQGEKARQNQQRSEANVDRSATNVSIGMESEQVTAMFGEPDRVDPSAYGYEWWIYNDQPEYFMQVGLKDGQVATIYSNAPGQGYEDLTIGMKKSDWPEHWKVKDSLSFRYGMGYYTFSLSENDQQERPLFIEDKKAVQIYVDIHDGQYISGIRVMDLETLLIHRPYKVHYIGSLPKQPVLSETEWREVARAKEQQVIDMVNVSRYRLGLNDVEWHEEVAVAAREHSEDMLGSGFFDHISPENGDLSNRLQSKGIQYTGAGENIAWNYIDAADVHHAWLNSPGHRENVIAPNYTHLGVGIVEKYYTQNFIQH